MFDISFSVQLTHGQMVYHRWTDSHVLCDSQLIDFHFVSTDTILSANIVQATCHATQRREITLRMVLIEYRNIFTGKNVSVMYL